MLSMMRRLDLKNRLCAFTAADDDQQIADQLLALFIAHVQFRVAKAMYSIFDDFDSAFDNGLSRVDQGHRLLAHEHGLSNFRGVCQIIQTHIEHANPGRIHSLLQLADESVGDDFIFKLQARLTVIG